MSGRGWEGVTAADLARMGKVGTPKSSKYRNVKVVVDGYTFDSKREAAHYHELKLREKAGEIVSLRVQPEFPLHAPVSFKGGATIGVATVGVYRADFSYHVAATGAGVVEDVKGMVGLPLYRWKAKHVALEYGIEIQEIR